MDVLLTLLASAGCNFVMGVPGADDIMLNYQTTSFHDALYVRQPAGAAAGAGVRGLAAADADRHRHGQRLHAGRKRAERVSVGPAFTGLNHDRAPAHRHRQPLVRPAGLHRRAHRAGPRRHQPAHRRAPGVPARPCAGPRRGARGAGSGRAGHRDHRKLARTRHAVRAAQRRPRPQPLPAAPGPGAPPGRGSPPAARCAQCTRQ